MELSNDYESELNFFAVKSIVPNRKYFLMIKCHPEKLLDAEEET